MRSEERVVGDSSRELSVTPYSHFPLLFLHFTTEAAMTTDQQRLIFRQR